jgi:hypothetical protein
MPYDFDSAREGGKSSKWFFGLLVPLVLIGVSLLSYARDSVIFLGKSRLYLEGDSTLWMTIAYASVGLFVKFHWFWGLHPRLAPYANLGKASCLLLFLICYLSIGWRIIIAK